MTDFKRFCEKYDLDPNTDRARRKYQEAEDNLKALYSASAKAQADEAILRAQQRAAGNQEDEA